MVWGWYKTEVGGLLYCGWLGFDLWCNVGFVCFVFVDSFGLVLFVDLGFCLVWYLVPADFAV